MNRKLVSPFSGHFPKDFIESFPLFIYLLCLLRNIVYNSNVGGSSKEQKQKFKLNLSMLLPMTSYVMFSTI